jgi:hypothetical protein
MRKKHRGHGPHCPSPDGNAARFLPYFHVNACAVQPNFLVRIHEIVAINIQTNCSFLPAKVRGIFREDELSVASIAGRSPQSTGVD